MNRSESLKIGIVGAIRRTEPVRLTTFEDGVRYMEFTDAVYESILVGRVVMLRFGRPLRV